MMQPIIFLFADIRQKNPPLGMSPSFQGFLPNIERRSYQIKGVTRDSTGAALGNCIVKFYTTADDVERIAVTSNATGNFSVAVPNPASTYYAIAYKAGSPDSFGTTANTIVGT